MSASDLPAPVRAFIAELYTHLISSNVAELRTSYLVSFKQLCERFYRTAAWPTADSIKSLVDEDPCFLSFYTCLTSSHTFSTLGGGAEAPPAALYASSWDAYCTLLDMLHQGSADLPTDLPLDWSFDLMSEFVYQCQNVAQYRLRGEANNGWGEIQGWGVADVITKLNGVVSKSNILAVLKGEEGATCPSALLRSMGYYALIGLSRLHTLLGDYYTALRMVQFCAPGASAIQDELLAAGSAHLHWGFSSGLCLLMMRRYTDAQVVLSNLIQHVTRNRQFLARTQQYDIIIKWLEKLAALLAITVALAPTRHTPEPAASLLRDRYQEKVASMQRGDGQSHFIELFRFACPRFIDPAVGGCTDEANEAQLELFLRQVAAAQTLPLRSYLSIYPSVAVSKLATFTDSSEPDVVAQLLASKAKATQMQRDPASPQGGALGGSLQPTSEDVRFVVEDGIISVQREQPELDLRQHFAGQISKCSDILQQVRALA